MSKKIKFIIIGAVLVLAVAGGSFFGGMKYQQNKKPDNVAGKNGAPSGQMGTPPSGGQGSKNGRNMVSGSIVSKDDTSMTIKTQDGSTKTVYLNSSTKVTKSTEGSTSDLATGDQVMANGTSNDDGSVTATSVSITPVQ